MKKPTHEVGNSLVQYANTEQTNVPIKLQIK